MVKKPGSRAAQTPTKALRDLAAADPASMGRVEQFRMTLAFVRKSNPRALPIVVASGLAVMAVVVVVTLLLHYVVLWTVMFIVLGVLLGILTSLTIFGRYARSAQFAALKGQPGAAVAILRSMRGNWTVTPTIAGNRNMDMVHRVVGKPGVILIGEGSPTGLASLLAAEKRKIARIAFGRPIIELQVGEGKGQVPIRNLQRKLMTMPRTLKPGAVRDLNNRLNAMPTSLQAPRGPMPQPGRMPRPPRPKLR